MRISFSGVELRFIISACLVSKRPRIAMLPKNGSHFLIKRAAFDK